MKRICLILALLCLLPLLAGCGAEAEVPEITLELWAHILIDGEVEFVQLEEGIVYDYYGHYWPEEIVKAREETGLQTVPRPLTVESNAVVTATSDDGGTGFWGGEVYEHTLHVPGMVYETYSSKNGGTFGFHFDQLDSESWAWQHEVPAGTAREVTISAWDEQNRNMIGDPDVRMRVRLVCTDDYDGLYTLEILSIERKQPTYW